MATQWNKIKIEYLEGTPPKEIAKKYKIKAKAIHEKASRENWTKEKTSIYKNLQEATENKIKNLTNKALNTLEDVLEDPEAGTQNKINAAKAVLDISGLKTQKNELSGGLEVQKVFVTPEMTEKTLEHIKKVINDQ